MEIKSKEELVNFLTDLEGRILNLQEQFDKMQPPVDEEPTDPEGTPEPEPEEIDELDALLQGE